MFVDTFSAIDSSSTTTWGPPSFYEDVVYDADDADGADDGVYRGDTTRDWSVLLYPQSTATTKPTTFNAQPTLLPLPIPSDDGEGDGGHVFETDFDEKWNVDDEDPPLPPPPPKSGPHPGSGGGSAGHDPPSVPTKSMPGTMVLVIGIILGAFVAMVLIVVIVLKMRTRVDGAIKCKPGHGGTIYYDQKLKDFSARIEFKCT